MIRSGAVGGWLGRLRSTVGALLVVLPVYAAGYIWTLQNSALFAPDTRYYAAMALWFGGADQSDSARQVGEYTAELGYASPGPDILFGFGLVQPRVVLPALSVPFVKLWGVGGLAVVPGIALALLVVLTTVMLTRRYGAGAAVASMLLVASSAQIVFFGAAMLTESLSALWTALTLLAAWRYLKRPNARDIWLIALLTAISAFTRQATLIVAGAFLAAFLLGLVLRRQERWGWPALAVTATSLGAQLFQSWRFPFSQSGQFQKTTGADSLGEAISKAPELVWKIIRLDFINAAAADRAQLALVIVALVSMMVLWRRSESHLLLGALLGIGLYNVTNGTPVGFRYAMPGVVFFAVSVAALVAWAQPARLAAGRAHESAQPGDRSADRAPHGEPAEVTPG
jgi:hypothetical protein